MFLSTTRLTFFSSRKYHSNSNNLPLKPSIFPSFFFVGKKKKIQNTINLMILNHRRRNDFQSGGGAIFEVKNGTGRRACASRRRGCLLPSEVGDFFENVVFNETIWCNIFHHVKHLTACLLGCLLL